MIQPWWFGSLEHQPFSFSRIYVTNVDPLIRSVNGDNEIEGLNIGYLKRRQHYNGAPGTCLTPCL